MNRLKLTIPIPPSINNDYMKPRAIMRGKKPMAIMYESKVAKDYKKELVKLIKKEVKEQAFLKENKFTVVEWTFYFPRINMDTNNYYKCAVDAITESGEIWIDDNVSMMIDKNIYYDSKNPRAEIEIYYSDKNGVFDSQQDLDMFISMNCRNCKKGNKIGQKGGCSIYKKALENRIQEELDLKTFECLKIKI